MAAEEKKKKKKKKKGRKAPVAVRVPKSITLTDDQKKQVAAINKEFGPKLAEVQKAVNGVITKEQRQARNAANKKAKADGVKGKARNAAIQAALNLTDDQDVQKAARAKFVEILTAEQKAKLPKKKKGKKKKKKKDA
jgi:Spy/CpxP family protein refolding chaperone